MIPIILRGKEIIVLNLRAPPTLAFYESKGDFESLTWFLGELKRDMSASAPVPRRLRGAQHDEEEEEIAHLLEDLKSHPNCRKAWFLSSVKGIEVHSTSN